MSNFLSVLIPVYNVSGKIERCFQSLACQDLRDVEFIFYDDASTDNSKALCEEFLKVEPRAKLFVGKRNIGTLSVRRELVRRAKGNYCFFLDADDSLSDSKVLTDALKEAVKYDVDILRFNAEPYGDCVPGDLEWFTHWLKYKGKASYVQGSDEILRLYFGDDQVCAWNVWINIYKKGVLNRAFKLIPNCRVIRCEDMVVTFSVSLVSQTFQYIHTRPFVRYCMVGGGSRIVSLEHFTKSSVMAPRNVEVYKKICIQAERNYDGIVLWLKQFLWHGLFGTLRSLPTKDQPKAFQAVVAHHDPLDIVEACARIFHSDDASLLTILRDYATNHSVNDKEIKTVAILCDGLPTRELEKVIKPQVESFKNWGLKVLIVSDSSSEKWNSIFTGEFERSQISESYLENRASQLKGLIESKQVDAVVTYTMNSPNLLLDLLLLKLLTVPTLINHQQLTFRSLYDSTTSLSEAIFSQALKYRLADGLIVLNSNEAAYYRQFGIQTHVIPNPIPVLHQKKELGLSIEGKNRVLWIGSIVDDKDRAQDALEIFKRLARARPDIQCDLVSLDCSDEAERRVKTFIRDNSIEKTIVWHGCPTDVESFYDNAVVRLKTSDYESPDETIAETLVHGVPLVIYELPNAEVLKLRKGVVTVKSGAIDEAFGALLKVLSDSNLQQKLSREASEAVETFKEKFNLEALWQTALEQLIVSIPQQGANIADLITYQEAALSALKRKNQLIHSEIVSMTQSQNISQTMNESDCIKIERYNKIVKILTHPLLFPHGSVRKNILLGFLRLISRGIDSRSGR